MTEIKKMDDSVLDEMQFQYLLKELELYINAEQEWYAARIGQIPQFFLTALTAIVGAIFMVIQIKQDFLLSAITVFVGSITLVAFGAFALYRACMDRAGLAMIRLEIFTIRQILLDRGVRPAQLTLPIGSKPLTSLLMF